MHIKELQAHWNEWGKTDPFYAILTREGKNNKRWRREEFFANGREEVDDLMAYIHSLALEVPRRKALDFGCGLGRLTQALCYHFEEVYGLDIAPSMIKLAREYNSQGNRCIYYLNHDDRLNLFNDDSFDFIYSNITLQHIAPRYSRNYLQEFLRILAPDGLLVFQLPDAPATAHKKTLRQSVKSVVPNRLLNLYRKLRYGGLKPVMQMYGINENLIVQMLAERGAAILNIKREPMAEEGWVSNIYFVRKQRVRSAAQSGGELSCAPYKPAQN